MQMQVAQPLESFLADVATVWPFARVAFHMFSERSGSRKCCATHVALKRLLSRVKQSVFVEATEISKTPSTGTTSMRLLVGMGPL